ncbi:MAG: hypothetical protein KPEEDBHJ_01578 [Anaerolineales bacterium]|nr:hypothetical protein [Anaerolineales bacterium]
MRPTRILRFSNCAGSSASDRAPEDAMRTKMILPLAFILATLICACTATAPPTPTPVPSPTPTPSGPKAGKWAGEDVSFIVTADNKVENFELLIPNSCIIKVSQIDIDSEGRFVVSQNYDFTNAADPVSVFLKKILGEKGTLDIISGQFTSDTGASGDHQDIFFCEEQAIMGDFPESEWTAQWIEP